MKPPSTGPITGANNAGQVMRAVALPSSDFEALRSTRTRPTGIISALPSPCIARAAMNSGRFCARPQPSELHVNTTIAIAKTSRATEAIGERAGSGNEHRRRQEVDGYAHAHADRRHAERRAHLRQQRGDDRSVQKLHEESNGDDERHTLGGRRLRLSPRTGRLRGGHECSLLSLRSRCEAALGTASIGALQRPDLTAAGGKFKPSAAARRAPANRSRQSI